MKFTTITQIIKDSGTQTFKTDQGKNITYRIIKVLGKEDQELMPMSVPNEFGELPLREDLKMGIDVIVQNQKPKLVLNKIFDSVN
ncbi:MAG: hypothetical protein KAU07_00795 [Candidatus Andersenbacteria bacterium]|nr:hypothetical protein [Candidatus Andersenbacteria bacterium]